MSILAYIEVFSEVVEQGSFTLAAQRLAMSKPVVSKQVSQLEKQLGVQLLHRTTRRLRLTEAGEVFAQYALNIVADSKEAEQAVLPLQSEPKGKLRVSAPESLALSILSDALTEFQRHYPQVELELFMAGQYVDLVEQGIDIALRMGKLDDSTLMARRLINCGFHVCASPDYWKKYDKPTHPTQLSNHNCLIYSPSPSASTWRFSGEQNEEIQVKVKGNLKSDTGNLILASGINGQGVFIAPSYMVQNYLESGQLESVLEEYMVQSTALYAVYPYCKIVSQKVRVFIEFLAEKWKV